MDGTHVSDHLRAIIYVLGGRDQTDRWIERCRAWIELRGYRLISMLTEQNEEDRSAFAAGLDMLTSGRADVLVVATTAYLPGDWVPRLEVAGDRDQPFAIPPQNRPASDRPRQRRPARKS